MLRNLLGLCVALFAAAAAQAQTDYVLIGNVKAHPTRILAKYRDQVVPLASANRLQQVGSRLQHRYHQLPQLAVLEDTQTQFAAGEAARRERLIQRINDLKQTGLFEYVEPDYYVSMDLTPTDQAFVDGTLWGLRNTGQSGGQAGADISATSAWDLTTGSTNVIVAVIDTGIRYTHRDLTNQMWRNPGESGGGKENNGIDDDNNGYVDDVFGINAIDDSGDPFDDNDHGTHCAGTIGAAANDGNPHVGVAWRVRLMGCKFLGGSGGGSTSDAIKCVDYAVSMGAKILNNSWGGGGYSQALYDSINNARTAGVIFLAAAGNSGTDNDQRPFYPCNYNLDNVISVAALTRNNVLADFSNFGETTVDLAAPGESIYSTTANSDTSYAIFDGTSMATPHVSGVAALIKALYPAADLAELRDRILLGTVQAPGLVGMCTTGGRLDAYNSLTISGSGIVQVSVNPASGDTLLASSTQPIFVSVSDLFPVINATVTGTISGGGSLTFLNNGVAPDAVASNGVYSANLAVPASTNPVTITITVSAPGKVGGTNVVTYSVVPPPPNDNFTNASKIASAGGLFLSNNRFATMETGEPLPAGVTNAAGSLWWAWTPNTSTNVFIDTTGSSIDTVLAVYTGSTLASLVPVASTNDVGLRKQGYVSFSATGGTAYRITVASASTNSMGSVQLRVTPGGQPDATAPQVLVSSPLSGVTVTTNLISISGAAADPAPNVTGVSEVLVGVNGAISYSASGTTNWSAPALLAPGINNIIVSAVDAAGNVSSPVNLQVNYFVNNPINDIFVNAIALSANSGVSSVNTTNATKEAGEPNHAGNFGGKSAWWTFQPAVDGVLTLGTTNSGFDTLLAVYAGSQVSALTPLASNDDAFDGAPGGFSSLNIAVRANQLYRIAVDGYGGAAGNVLLNYGFAPATVYHLTVNPSAGGVADPGSQDVPAGGSVTLTATANPGYQFVQWSGDLVSLANPLVVTITGNRTVTANFQPIAFTDGFETGGFAALGWTTGGNAPWLVESTNVAAGSFAARSGSIGDGQTSSLILNRSFRAGVGSFSVNVSSEPVWDVLTFILDGVTQQQWSGDVGWTSYAFPVSAGVHSMEWRYAKDPNNSVGMDAAFIDNVNLPLVLAANASTPAHLTAVRQAGGSVFINLTGQTNQLYWLQASTNLQNWVTISTNVLTSGYANVSDPASATSAARFYRAVSPAP